jgi:hypothetical protein
MKKIIILFLFISTTTIAQKNENISIGASFAHFDDTDGFEVNMAYYSSINRYLGLEIKVNYAKTNDFPNIYRFSNQIDQNYWFSKSSIFNIAPNLHLVFIDEKNHHFSFYGGIGLLFLDTADNTNFITNPNEFNFESSVESYSTLSKTIGLKYTYFIKNYGFGLDAKLISPVKNNDDYFGQDNFRAIGIFITKQF